MKSRALIVKCLFVAVWLSMATDVRTEEPPNVSSPAVDRTVGKVPGESRDDNGPAMKLVWRPPGKFTNTPGARSTATVRKKHSRIVLGRKGRTGGDFMTCTVTSGNGAWTGTHRNYQVALIHWSLKNSRTKPDALPGAVGGATPVRTADLDITSRRIQEPPPVITDFVFS